MAQPRTSWSSRDGTRAVRSASSERPARSPRACGHAYARSAARRVWLFTALARRGRRGRLPARSSATCGRCRAPFHPPWPVLALGFLAAEAKVIVVHFRRETHSFSLSEIPAVIGLFFLTPDRVPARGAAGVGVGAARARRGQSAVKFAFNLANFALIAVVDLAIFHAHRARRPARPARPTGSAAFAATLVARASSARSRSPPRSRCRAARRSSRSCPR